MENLIKEFAQFGISGLMFIMWWLERTDKFKQKKDKEEAQFDRSVVTEALQNNTVAMTELRDEIRELKNHVSKPS